MSGHGEAMLIELFTGQSSPFNRTFSLISLELQRAGSSFSNTGKFTHF